MIKLLKSTFNKKKGSCLIIFTIKSSSKSEKIPKTKTNKMKKCLIEIRTTGAK